MKLFKIGAPVLGVLLFAVGLAPNGSADLTSDIQKLKSQTFCINAGFDVAWQETANVLRRMEIGTTLADKPNGVITTEFSQAEYGQLSKISKNPRPLAKGRFTMKIKLEAVSPDYTKINIVLQVRQPKMFSKKERLLKSRGSFEKYLAYQINQRAIGVQFPRLYEIRLGMSFIPDLKTERYRVADVEADSPAGEAGFESDDQLLEINGHKITIRKGLFEELLPEEDEKLMQFKIRRESSEMTIPVWVVRLKDEDEIGFQLSRDPGTEKFAVKYVMPGSKASGASFVTGDLLLEINGKPLKLWSDYYRAILAARQSPSLVLTLLRGGEKITATISKA